MLTALAAFAEIFAHPAALGLVLALALLVADRFRLRLGAALVGAALTVPGLLEGVALLPGAAAVTGGVAAALLQAEVMLHLVLPAARWVGRMAAAAWALGCAVVGFLLLPGPVRRVPPDPRRLPPIEPEP